MDSKKLASFLKIRFGLTPLPPPSFSSADLCFQIGQQPRCGTQHVEATATGKNEALITYGNSLEDSEKFVRAAQRSQAPRVKAERCTFSSSRTGTAGGAERKRRRQDEFPCVFHEREPEKKEEKKNDVASRTPPPPSVTPVSSQPANTE